MPLLPWGIRNAVTLHDFKFSLRATPPSPAEFASRGYFEWTGTWLVRYRDVDLTVWKLGSDPLQLSDFPDSAFDSPEERARVANLLADYDDNCCDVLPDWDAKFSALARERTALHPLRTYLTVPLARVLTLWFTPRVELLPYTGKLWPLGDSFETDPVDFSVTLLFGALGIFYVGLAIVGALRGARSGILAAPPTQGRRFPRDFLFRAHRLLHAH